MTVARFQINPRLAGALAYVIGPLVLLFRRDHPVVRFHSMQACLLALSLLAIDLSLWVLLATIYQQSWDAGVAAYAVLTWVFRGQVLLWMVMVYIGLRFGQGSSAMDRQGRGTAVS